MLTFPLEKIKFWCRCMTWIWGVWLQIYHFKIFLIGLWYKYYGLFWTQIMPEYNCLCHAFMPFVKKQSLYSCLHVFCKWNLILCPNPAIDMLEYLSFLAWCFTYVFIFHKNKKIFWVRENYKLVKKRSPLTSRINKARAILLWPLASERN